MKFGSEAGSAFGCAGAHEMGSAEEKSRRKPRRLPRQRGVSISCCAARKPSFHKGCRENGATTSETRRNNYFKSLNEDLQRLQHLGPKKAVKGLHQQVGTGLDSAAIDSLQESAECSTNDI